MTVEDILARLVAVPSVVGRPNAAIVECVADLLAGTGARVAVLPGPEGDRANLFATLGPADRPGLILSGHTDVVPAGEPDWRSDPFHLTVEGDRLVGRGTSDMKGFLAAALAAFRALAGRTLQKPIHLAFSYDEEAGCRGVPHMIARLPELCAKPEAAVIGEPSGLVPILGHKGKAAARIAVQGRSGHSSRPDLALNAVHAMTEVLAVALASEAVCKVGPLDADFAPPWSTVQIGIVAGGEALNVIPATCRAELEARAVPGVSPAALLEPVRAALSGLEARGFATAWEWIADYPGLALPREAGIARCLAALTGQAPIAAVSYGTEAGLFQAAGIDAIVCGPGDIARAHKANEYIERAELEAARVLIERLCLDFAT
ncbi:acetylornithine deacetylase [Prosthecodimorpha staleyi]|uniref:Acetylornithine deacetylase n=1 Tax=Prosthecodimorpha staleyi TaxID=2840188 RepID=A0A947GK29_9HYPH|nr:acetylornithine deacetylase [Prosthecodimorpha staleyi]MBT9292984.1 acetylornithine deacetylase [Prosthecodimorpha staleyi]